MANFNFRLEDVLAEKEGKKSFYKTFLYFSVKRVCFKPRTGYYAVILGKKDCIKVPLPNPVGYDSCHAKTIYPLHLRSLVF